MNTPSPAIPRPRAAAPPRGRVRAACTLLVLLAAPLVGGCLEKPKIEDRWTRLDIVSSSLAQNQSVAPGVRESVTVRARITYRAIVTGFAVAELRASPNLGVHDVAVSPSADRVTMATDIDRLLANSVSVGRATRAITGWDHLMQTIDFSFGAVSPAAMDSSVTAGGGPAGLFLLCYLGSGEKIELRDGSDSIRVTPFPSAQYQILPVGLSLAPQVGP